MHNIPLKFKSVGVFSEIIPLFSWNFAFNEEFSSHVFFYQKFNSLFAHNTKFKLNDFLFVGFLKNKNFVKLCFVKKHLFFIFSLNCFLSSRLSPKPEVGVKTNGSFLNNHVMTRQYMISFLFKSSYKTLSKLSLKISSQPDSEEDELRKVTLLKSLRFFKPSRPPLFLFTALWF